MPGERNFRRSEFVLRTRMVLSPALSTGLKNYYFPYTNNKKCLFMWAALPPDDGTPQAAIELGSIPFVIYSNKKSHPKVAFLLEQMTGIEPAYSAWEADVLPLNYICTYPRYYYSTAGNNCQCETVDGFRLSDPREDGTLCPLSR